MFKGQQGSSWGAFFLWALGCPRRPGSGGVRQLEPQALGSLSSRGWGEGLGHGDEGLDMYTLVVMCKVADGGLGESIFKEQRNSQELCLLLIIIRVMLKLR